MLRFEKLPKADPLNRLPPSRGTTFTRTPPLDASTEIAPFRRPSSCAAASLSEKFDHAEPEIDPHYCRSATPSSLTPSCRTHVPPWAARTFPRSPLRAAHIALVGCHARQRRPDRRERPRRRQRVQRFLRELLPFGAALHVHDRRFPLVTVIVSETAPTFRDALTGAVNPAEISMPSRRTH